MSTSGGYHEYIGVFSTSGGYHEYIRGYHEYIGDVQYIGGSMSTMGDIMITLGDTMSTSGECHDYIRGCSVHWGISCCMSGSKLIKVENLDILNILRCTHDIPRYTHGIP